MAPETKSIFRRGVNLLRRYEDRRQPYFLGRLCLKNRQDRNSQGSPGIPPRLLFLKAISLKLGHFPDFCIWLPSLLGHNSFS